MKRLMTAVIALCLMLHAGSASAEVHQGLKSLFDQYHYTMQVEWDQQESTTPELAKRELLKGLDQLRQTGVSDLAIREAAVAQVKNETLKRELTQVLSLSRTLEMSPVETEAFMFETLKKSYQQGANWSGEESYTLLGVLIFIALIAAVAVTADRCPKEGTCYECDLAYEECP